MDEKVRDAVFGNVGTTIAFRVGPFDAEVLETIFMPQFTKEDIVSLDRRQIYLSLMIDGVGSAPFSAVTIPPIEAPPVSYREQVIASSREQFTALRDGVEKVIIEELAASHHTNQIGVVASAASVLPPDARMRRKPADRPPVQPIQRENISPARPFVPRPTSPRPTIEHQILPSKSAEDLKSILRTMTVKNNAEKGQKQTQNQQSLKGALAEVLAKNKEVQPPAAAEPPREKQPFEVPEDALRKVLKGET